jgi:hypothetical protein
VVYKIFITYVIGSCNIHLNTLFSQINAELDIDKIYLGLE